MLRENMAAGGDWTSGSPGRNAKKATIAGTAAFFPKPRPGGTAVSSHGDQDATLILSAAMATRFEIGWATSPASFSIVSADFDVSAIIVSNIDRA